MTELQLAIEAFKETVESFGGPESFERAVKDDNFASIDDFLEHGNKLLEKMGLHERAATCRTPEYKQAVQAIMQRGENN